MHGITRRRGGCGCAPEAGRGVCGRQLAAARAQARPAPGRAREVLVPAHDAHVARRRAAPRRCVVQQAQRCRRAGQQPPGQVHAPGVALRARGAQRPSDQLGRRARRARAWKGTQRACTAAPGRRNAATRCRGGSAPRVTPAQQTTAASPGAADAAPPRTARAPGRQACTCAAPRPATMPPRSGWRIQTGDAKRCGVAPAPLGVRRQPPCDGAIWH